MATKQQTALVTTDAERVHITTRKGNYIVQAGTLAPVTLKRDIDFGLIPNTKRPSLFKAGAEKIVIAYGLLKRYTVETRIEQTDDTEGRRPVFFYLVRCDLLKIGPNGQEYIISNGHGSANTREKRNGFAEPWDMANTAIKMAEKRALVAAAISLAGVSDLFAQDMENEDYIEAGMAKLAQTADEDKSLTKAQLKQLYAVAGERGLTVPQAQQKLMAAGYASVKDITQKDFDSVLALMEAG